MKPRSEPNISQPSAAEAVPIGRLPSTQWSVIIEAGHGNEPEARAAVGQLYEIYRPALLAFLRRQGHSPDNAEELLQSFFALLLTRGALAQVEQRGRFRTWLLACLCNHVRDRWAHENAAMRRPAETVLPIGGSQESNCVQPAGRELAADREYDRQYAIAFLGTVMKSLESDYDRRGRPRLFTVLHPFLQSKKPGQSHAQAAAQLDMTENAVSQEVFRMKKRYRELFKTELEKLCGPENFEDEKRHLFAALTG